MGETLDNVNPMLYDRTKDRALTDADYDDAIEDPVDVREIFDLIRDINDPEHPLTLEQLNVVTEEQIAIDVDKHDIRVKLLRSLPDRFKVSVSISPGTHASEAAINKQLADKERVAAALENGHLLQVVNQCLDVTS